MIVSDAHTKVEAALKAVLQAISIIRAMSGRV
jgi:hypothetical protein